MTSAVFSFPQFRRFFFGAFFAVQAIWVQRVTLAWLAWEISGSAAYVGLVAGLGFIPTMLSGPLFGVLADRVDIRRAAFVTNGAMVGCLIVLASILPWIGLTGLALAALAIGIVTSAHHPVRMSLGPRLVPGQVVQHVVAVQALNFNLARMVAPAAAGLLIAGCGARTALWTAAAFYVPMLVVLFGLDPRALPPRAPQRFLHALAEGVVYSWQAPLIRAALGLTLVSATMLRGAMEVLPVLADGAFGRGAAGLGALTAAAGAGAMIAAAMKALGIGAVGARIPPAVVVAVLAGQGSVAAMGLAPGWPLALLATAAAGFCATWVGVSLQAAIQSDLPDAYRGRVMSLWTVVGFGTVAFGAFAIGQLADLLGIRAALTLCGGAGAVALIAILIGQRGAQG